MAQITVVQSVADPDGGNASLAGVNAGRILVLVVAAQRFFGATPIISSVSGGGATWTQRVAQTQGEFGLWIYTGTGTTGGTVTMTVSGTWDGVETILYETDANASAFDVAAGNNAATGTAVSSGATAALQDADDLAISAAIAESTSNSFTAGGGFTEDYDVAPTGIDAKVTSAQLQVTSASVVTGSFTAGLSAPWCCGVVTIKTAGGGGTSALPPGLGPVVGMTEPMHHDAALLNY